MADAIAYLQWENYERGVNGRGFFASQPLTFNSRQERVHKVSVGGRLWLVSRCPADSQHYFVGLLSVASLSRNAPGSSLEQMFGEFGIIADEARSVDLNKRFPADGLLRALHFDSKKPIKFGAHIGQALQTIRLLSPEDELVLTSSLERIQQGESPVLDAPFGLWTKCDAVYADYFLKNWRARREMLAFLLYDSPPVLPTGAPVFVHSDKNLRLVASFRGSEFIAGYKPTTDAEERLVERERVRSRYRAVTIDPPTKPAFDKFWDGQHGVRSLFLMDNLTEFAAALPFKVYGRGLEWGYPMGVGYRYLTLSQSLLLLRASELPDETRRSYVDELLNCRG